MLKLSRSDTEMLYERLAEIAPGIESYHLYDPEDLMIFGRQESGRFFEPDLIDQLIGGKVRDAFDPAV